MSKHQKPKTEGLEWLFHSLNAFNGSGYADMDSPEAFLHSYRAYKTMRKEPQAVRLSQIYEPECLPMLEQLLAHTYGASRTPSKKAMANFEKYKNSEQTGLF